MEHALRPERASTSSAGEDHAPADDQHDDRAVAVDLGREHAEAPDRETGDEQAHRAGAHLARQPLGGEQREGGRAAHVTLYAPLAPVSCRAMSVAIVGSTVRDVVYLPGRAPTHSPGGSPLFAARALAALGVRPGIATRCDDPALAAPIAELADAALPAASTRRSCRASCATARTASATTRWPVSASPGARTTSPAGRRPPLRDATWVHAGTQRGGDLGPGGAGRARRAAGAASRSTRRGRCGARSSGRSCSAASLDAALLQHVQALKLSEEEALAAFAHDRRRRDPRALPGARDPRHVRLPRRRDRLRRARRATSRPRP